MREKLQRYGMRNYVGTHNQAYGDWCKDEDVRALEERTGKLEQENAKLREKLAAAEAIIGMIATADAGTWSSALCKDYLAPPAAGEGSP